MFDRRLSEPWPPELPELTLDEPTGLWAAAGEGEAARRTRRKAVVVRLRTEPLLAAAAAGMAGRLTEEE